MSAQDIVAVVGAVTALVSALGGIVIALYRLHLRITDLENEVDPPPKV